MNHSCHPEVASRTYQETSVGFAGPPLPLFLHLPPQMLNRSLGKFLEGAGREKRRGDLDKEILKQFLGKVSCVLLDSLSFEKYHKNRVLIIDGGKT